MTEIKVYSTPVCPWCHTLKQFLTEKGVEFTDINVAEDVSGREELLSKSGHMGVPQMEINGKMIVGFDQYAIEEELEKMKDS